MTKVFLSYSAEDRPTASLLNDRLRRHGTDTWWDQDLQLGSNWPVEITNAVREAAAVIVLVTPNSLDSHWVKQEWSAALGASQRVIPVLAGGAHFADLPEGLAHIQAIDLDEDVERGVERIIGVVSALQRSDEPPPSNYVEIEAIIEDVLERKLASMGIDRATTAEPNNEQDPLMVFVVTSFQSDMDPVFEAIDAAARAVGLRAERVKDVPGDYRITDRILTSIRRARLVVVDLTHERPNVYFELGFARGLGKTVITIMREGTKAHFDVQDWTHLSYVDSRPLERDLLERFQYEVNSGTGSTSGR